MKVYMILTNGYDPDLRVFKEAKFIKNLGNDIEILCWDRENKYLDKKCEVIEGIHIHRFFPHALYGTGLKQIGPFIKFYREIKNYLKNKDEEYILHCHDLDGAIIGYTIKSVIAKVFDMHEYYLTDNNYFIKKIKGFCVKTIQNKFDFIIYLNDKQKKDVSRKNSHKLVFLPNYPEGLKFQKIEKYKNEMLRINYIGIVRHLESLKVLMELSNLENVKVGIFGGGTSLEEIKKKSSDYENTDVFGSFDHNKVGELYRETDLLYCVYRTENENDKNAFPTKFFESILTTTPIIVNKNSAMGAFVNKNNIGFTIDLEDKNEVKNIIVKINENRMILDEKIKNLKNIQKNYQWENVVNNLLTIYERGVVNE